jgi:hypothetical protein
MVSSVFGVLVGILLYIGMFVLLFWNEGRTVKTHQDLEEGKHAVVESPVDKVDPQFDQKLVHMVGPATTAEILADEHGVKLNAIKLKRVVEMFQWTESKSTRKRKSVGGGETTETTYTYHKEWVDHPVSSAGFHNSGTHHNPGSFPVGNNSWNAKEVQFGAFKLSSELIQMINSFERIMVNADATPPAGFRPHEQGFYRGTSPESPEIGDVRIHYEAVKPTPVSVIAQQQGNSFGPFMLTSGRKQEMLTVGEHTAEKMYEDAESMNQLIAWAIRAGGFVGMWIGLMMMAAPLGVLLDVIPIFGDIARWGTGAMAFVIAVVSATIGIAVSWFVYHPLIAVVAVVVGIGLILLVRMMFSGRARAKEVDQLFSPPPPPPPPPVTA